MAIVRLRLCCAVFQCHLSENCVTFASCVCLFVYVSVYLGRYFVRGIVLKKQCPFTIFRNSIFFSRHFGLVHSLFILYVSVICTIFVFFLYFFNVYNCCCCDVLDLFVVLLTFVLLFFFLSIIFSFLLLLCHVFSKIDFSVVQFSNHFFSIKFSF